MKSKKVKQSNKGCQKPSKVGRGIQEKEPDIATDSLPSTSDLMPLALELCPRLKLNASDDSKKLGLEDLDPMQRELEQMLLAVVRRSRSVRKALDAMDGKLIGKSGMSFGDSDVLLSKTPMSRKRGKGKDCTDSPKQQSDDLDLYTPKPLDTCSVSSSSSSAASMSFQPQPLPLEDEASVGRSPSKGPGRRRFRWFFPANDFPDRFWAFVDDYCAPCTTEDVQFLEQLVKECSDDAVKTTKTIQESKNAAHNRSLQKSEENTYGKRRCVNGIKKCEAYVSAEYDNAEIGTFTQKLIQALMEDTSSHSTKVENESDQPFHASPGRIMRSLNLPSFDEIERRIKKELMEHGLLDKEIESDEDVKEDDEDSEDEVTQELQTRQAELKELQAVTKLKLERLLKVVKANLRRTELMSALEDLDKQIADLCEKYCSSHPRKRPLKKEKDLIFAVINEREELISEIDKIPIKW